LQKVKEDDGEVEATKLESIWSRLKLAQRVGLHMGKAGREKGWQMGWRQAKKGTGHVARMFTKKLQ
jgi:hypothetical protein